MTDLISLIRVSPFSDEKRLELIRNMNTMTPDQRFEITNLCWDGLAQQFDKDVRHKFEQMILEMGMGEKKYTQEDFDKAEEDLVNQLGQKLGVANDADRLNQLREKIQSAPTSNQTSQ